MLKSVKRLLFLFHRWSGVILSVIFGLWFASGFVMMYVGYPELTQAERLSGMPPLAAEAVRVTPSQALSMADLAGPLEQFSLSTVLSRPAYQILDAEGGWHTVFADDASVFRGFTAANVLQAASQFAPGVTATYLQKLDIDQWTLSSSLNSLRPFHKLQLHDSKGTQLYVSDVTGLVARDSTRLERGWNWLGTTIHWIYPLVLRRHGDLWADLVIWLSLAGSIVALSGLVIGSMRLKLRSRYKRNRLTPYTGIQKLHHVLGLLVGGFVLMFVFSGLLSMNPWGVFDNKASYTDQLAGYHGRALSAESISALPAGMARHLAETRRIREISWRHIGGEEFLVLSEAAGKHTSLLLNAGKSDLQQIMQQAASQLIPDAAVVSSAVLSKHDSYYYSHHDSYRPLPVLRVKFDDPAHTWFHLNLNTGEVMNRLTATDRVERWLYNGMHSLDFPWLIQNRPLWDAVVLLLSLAGMAFSVTSVLIGWRRLKIKVSAVTGRGNKLL